MTPQTIRLRELKAAALKCGADGVLILRGLTDAVLMHAFEDQRELTPLELNGRMLFIAVFPQTDDGAAGIES